MCLHEKMGIDLVAGGRVKVSGRKAPKSKNVYLLLLVKLYRFLARRTTDDARKFNATVLKRLFMSKMNRPPISVSKLSKHCAKLDRKNKGASGKILCVVGTVTNDERKADIPAMKICALRFTETARAKIVKAGGECMTFDQLAMAAPTGEGCLLLRGRKTAREANKHFGAPGVPNSSTKCVHPTSRLCCRILVCAIDVVYVRVGCKGLVFGLAGWVGGYVRGGAGLWVGNRVEDCLCLGLYLFCLGLGPGGGESAGLRSEKVQRSNVSEV